MSTAPDQAEPERFGPYLVHEQLGLGGMAAVHRAVKQGIAGFERTVALKRLRSHLVSDESFVTSFIREASLASKLQHANIVQIYDLGKVESVYYIAMELIAGWDLRKILRHTAYSTGPMPAGITLSLIGQMLDALHYAHTLSDEGGEPLGLVHRDISPGNAIVAREGVLKLIDFGIAKATAAKWATEGGAVKGKFSYMCPEAIVGTPPDRRSDLFSVGVVAWELLAARPLFTAPNQVETIKRVRGMEIPPPSRHHPDCPTELDEIILTALARSPDERWQTADAMRNALDQVLARHGLRASHRDIAEHLAWTFAQPARPDRWDAEPETELSIQVVWGRDATMAVGEEMIEESAIAAPQTATARPTSSHDAVTALEMNGDEDETDYWRRAAAKYNTDVEGKAEDYVDQAVGLPPPDPQEVARVRQRATRGLGVALAAVALVVGGAAALVLGVGPGGGAGAAQGAGGAAQIPVRIAGQEPEVDRAMTLTVCIGEHGRVTRLSSDEEIPASVERTVSQWRYEAPEASAPRCFETRLGPD